MNFRIIIALMLGLSAHIAIHSTGNNVNTCSTINAGNNISSAGNEQTCLQSDPDEESGLGGMFNAFKDKVKLDFKATAYQSTVDLKKLTRRTSVTVTYPEAGKVALFKFTPSAGMAKDKLVQIFFVTYAVESGKNYQIPTPSNIQRQLDRMNKAKSPHKYIIVVYRKIGREIEATEIAQIFTPENPATNKQLNVQFTIHQDGKAEADTALYQTDVNGVAKTYDNAIIDLVSAL